jgi:hypothetical protein
VRIPDGKIGRILVKAAFPIKNAQAYEVETFDEEGMQTLWAFKGSELQGTL